MKQQVVFGLIGAGGISQSQHLPNLTRARNIHLKSVCDYNPDALARAGRQYGIEHLPSDHRQLLDDPDIQAVLIATPPHNHVTLAIEALQAGKHVYVEKPLAETVEECRRLLPVQHRSGRLLAVGHNRRMAPAVQQLRTILKAHGGPRNIHYRIADNYYVWGAQLEPGTRVLHEVCHVFDLLRYLADSPITSVYCAASRADDDIIALTFASGCVATIMSSGYVMQDMPKERLEVVVDLGAATMTDFVEVRTFGLRDFEPVYRFAGRLHPSFDTMHRYLLEKQGVAGLLDLRRIYWEKLQRLEALVKAEDGSPERRELEQYLHQHAPNPNYMVDKGWQQAVEHLANCILNGRPCELASVEEGLEATLLARVAMESRRSGQVIKAPFQLAEA